MDLLYYAVKLYSFPEAIFDKERLENIRRLIKLIFPVEERDARSRIVPFLAWVQKFASSQYLFLNSNHLLLFLFWCVAVESLSFWKKILMNSMHKMNWIFVDFRIYPYLSKC